MCVCVWTLSKQRILCCLCDFLVCLIEWELLSPSFGGQKEFELSIALGKSEHDLRIAHKIIWAFGNNGELRLIRDQFEIEKEHA